MMTENEKPSPVDPKTPEKSPGAFSVLQSVAAAAFGVQSEKKRSEDFQRGKPADFILYGVIFTVIFVVTLIVIVSNIVDSAAP